jgi:DNA-binding MarR family transcriptional regulator
VNGARGTVEPAADLSTDHAGSAWQAMRTLVLELNDRRAVVSAEIGLSFVRIKALGKLARAPMTMRDLAAALGIDAPYTTVVVDDLEERGLAERRPDPEDRRRKIVAILPAGARLSRRAQQLLHVPPPALAALAADDLAALDRILHAALDAAAEQADR